jgi:hypothetical protein
MTDGADGFDNFLTNSRVKFVTFNFDTIVEERIMHILRGIYRRDFNTTLAAEFLPVIHVHGFLTEIPAGVPMAFRPGEGGCHPLWLTWIINNAQRINVTADNIEDAPVLRDARRAIEDADIVCFLGFSYNRTNMEKRLNVRETIQKQEVFGTAKGMPETARTTVEARFGVKRIGLGKNHNCREFLDWFHVLREA